jgi:tetratricopeptide (TPR) repeat protein
MSTGRINELGDKIMAVLFDQSLQLPRRSAAERVALEIIRAGSVAGTNLFRKLQAEEPDSMFISEADFNRVGYELIGLGRYPEAITILRINMGNYPASDNTYDSLAEAYRYNGQREMAIRYYRLALQKLPDDPRISPLFRQVLLRSARRNLQELEEDH